ncbi:MAG: lipopolysaccharide transport system ATP-binding protein [Pseudohongiellaceae bacterium]|jgi:lipopolysaccharide transport system ATP-binding protein
MNLISVKNVGVKYRKFNLFTKNSEYDALSDVNFTVKRGETLGVLGRNGAGKSTLLKLLAGILMPDNGSIEFKTNSISLLSLQAGFEDELDGIDNIYLNALLMGIDKETVKKSIGDIVEFAELERFISQPLKTYSAGMRARLGFSIAHQLNFDVLLLDEVLGVGDARFREKSSNAMQHKIKSEQTVVLVSHSPGTIRNLCDRAVWIEDGVAVMEGDTGLVVDAYLKYVLSSENQ